MTWIILAAAAAAAAQPAPNMVRAQDPNTLVSALHAAGYTAKLGTDKVGDPLITSAVSGTTFQIFFYNCKDHKDCATIQFHSGYDLKSAPSLELINEWNRTNRFGRAFLDKENDPILEMDIDLDDGGMSAELFIDNLEFWTSAIDEFEKRIRPRRSAKRPGDQLLQLAVDVTTSRRYIRAARTIWSEPR